MGIISSGHGRQVGVALKVCSMVNLPKKSLFVTFVRKNP